VSDARVLFADAPAKINRELRVGPRRTDGFHDIRSRFAAVDLADRLEVRESDRLDLVCDPPELPADGSNLVIRAARALAETLALPPRGFLTLRKRVPVGAGLGGGSSDAAAALRLLGRLWGRTVSDVELSRIAATLGSDVPFFLSGGEADVTGRGETVAPREKAVESEILLLVPPFSISTAEVYAAFDRIGSSKTPPARLEIEESGRFFGPNDLEPAVLAVRPEMKDYIETARGLSRECSVTGSGSTVVLAGAAPGSADEIARRLPGSRTISTRTISRAEFRRRAGAEIPPR